MVRPAVVETYGEKIESRGRFLPRLNLLYGRYADMASRPDSSGTVPLDSVDVEHGDRSVAVEVRQRVAEFGKTADSEYQREDRERDALYHRENTVVGVFSDIRRTFRSLLIIDEQLSSNDSLLQHYAGRVTRASDRLEKGIGLRTALLTAKMNQLGTRERILVLRADRRRRLSELKKHLGLKQIPSDVVLVEEPQPPLPTEDSCVVLALESSTEVADCKAEVIQAGKRLGQTGWDWVLDEITFSAGMAKGNQEASLELMSGGEGQTRAWALDAVGRRYVHEPGGLRFATRDTVLRYTASIEITLPVFRGAKRHGTTIEAGARYTKARAELIDKTRETERSTRDAFYAYELSRQRLGIAGERVSIAQERYELAETQHELGRMSDEGLDAFRKDLFQAQNAFFGQQFDVLHREEDLRAETRVLQ